MKNYEIELWRFIFAVIIIIFHCNGLKPGVDFSDRLFSRGAFGVEVFFMLSGYLIMNAAMRSTAVTGAEIAENTFRQVKKRWVRLLPYGFFATAMTLLVAIIFEGRSIQWLLEKVWHGLPQIFFLYATGITSDNIVGPTWSISVMLFSIWIIYPFLLKNRDIVGKIIAPLGGMFLYGWLFQTYKGFGEAQAWNGFFFRGFLRGIAGIMLGVFCYEITQIIKMRFKSKHALPTLLQILCIFICFYYMEFETGGSYVVSYVLFACIMLSIIFSETSYLSSLLNKKVFAYLGALSLPMYFNHSFVITIIRDQFPDINYNLGIILVVSLTFIICVLQNKIVKLIEKK